MSLEMARLMVIPLLLAASAFGALPELTDVHGKALPGPGEAKATVIYFITHDCPISNQYAPEIGRICQEYGERGVQCYLAYVDPDLTVEGIDQHRTDYSHQSAAILDAAHEIVKAVGATVTPEAVVLDSKGEVAYLGRINNFYAGLGKPRRFVTQHDLRDALDAVLAGKPVENPRTQAVGCYVPTLR